MISFSFGWSTPHGRRLTTSTCSTSGWCRHSCSTPSPTIPVAPVTIALSFIRDVLRKLLKISHGNTTTQCFHQHQPVYNNKIVKYRPPPVQRISHCNQQYERNSIQQNFKCRKMMTHRIHQERTQPYRRKRNNDVEDRLAQSCIHHKGFQPLVSICCIVLYIKEDTEHTHEHKVLHKQQPVLESRLKLIRLLYIIEQHRIHRYHPGPGKSYDKWLQPSHASEIQPTSFRTDAHNRVPQQQETQIP